MAGPKSSILVDLLEEHFEELAFLWGQRRAALYSSQYTSLSLADLEERIEAHVQGLMVGGDSLAPLVETELKEGDADTAFAGAFALLRVGKEKIVLDAFNAAAGARLDGIRQALASSTPGMTGSIRPFLKSSSPTVALAAAEAIYFLQPGEAKSGAVNPYLKLEDAKLRRAAWRVAALGIACTPDAYQLGFRDADRLVRREALYAAAWNRFLPLLDHCRAAANKPLLENDDAIGLLAILGASSDWPRFLTLAQARELGPKRFDWLGLFGHPGGLELVLKGMEDSDPRTVLAAGTAFTHITGVDLGSGTRVTLMPDDGHEPDEFEKEFLDEAELPDVAKARNHWEKSREEWKKGTRWCKGWNVSQGETPEILAKLDRQSYGEAVLRAKFVGAGQGTRADLERFPQSS